MEITYYFGPEEHEQEVCLEIDSSDLTEFIECNLSDDDLIDFVGKIATKEDYEFYHIKCIEDWYKLLEDDYSALLDIVYDNDYDFFDEYEDLIREFFEDRASGQSVEEYKARNGLMSYYGISEKDFY